MHAVALVLIPVVVIEPGFELRWHKLPAHERGKAKGLSHQSAGA